jgi:hypothetical protein
VERRWQKVAARDGAVEARGEVGLGNLFSGVCLQAERSAGPRRSWSRRCWWIRREREGNAKANAKGTEKEREGHAKRKREGNAKPKGMLKAEKGIRRGVTTSRARAPLACAVPVRVPVRVPRMKKIFARTRHARARPGHARCSACCCVRCGWGSEWTDTSPRRCLGIRKTLNPPRYQCIQIDF